ncbi:MAG: lysoplasmalogenase [Promicromonosporaceae bacterium]|nr:lysoplasmalogenase [Promicromonosporaceae bacterium]
MHDDVHDLGPGFDPEPVPEPGGALPSALITALTRRLEPWLPNPAAQGWFGAFALVAVLHLAAQLVGPVGGDVARMTQGLLVPPLAAALWCATTAVPRPRLVTLAVVGLMCSWAGDTVPALVSPDASFPVMMAIFLCAQVVYVLAFWPLRRRSVLLANRPVAALYGVVYVVLVGTVAVRLLDDDVPGAPALVVALAVYGAVLVTMAMLATGVDRLAGLGGVLFVASDGLLGVQQAVPTVGLELPWGLYAFLVMLLYIAAQTLLVAGVRRCSVGGRF